MPEVFYALAVLACPVGMGVMMWAMRGGHRPSHGASTHDAELAELRAEVEQLRNAQRGPTAQMSPAPDFDSRA